MALLVAKEIVIPFLILDFIASWVGFYMGGEGKLKWVLLDSILGNNLRKLHIKFNNAKTSITHA